MAKIKTYTFITGDLTDKTSWFSDAGTKTGQALTDSGAGLTWTSPDANWIELSKVTMRGDLGSAYDIKVYVDGSEVTTGFTINYAAGSVTFNSSQSGKAVTSDYRFAQSSDHVITPDPGKYYELPLISAQFTSGATFASGFEFKVWINHAGTGDTDYCVGTVSYKHARDIIARSTSVQTCKLFGGISSDVIKLVWDLDTMFGKNPKNFSYKLFPVGTVVDPELREFNKISFSMIDDEVVNNSDFCSATFNFIEDSI